MKVLFTGGGTGGHVFPIIALSRELRRIQGKGKVQFFYLGPQDDFASAFLSQEGIKVDTVLAGKIRRYWDLKSLFQNLVDVFIKVPVGVLQSFSRIFFLSPDVVFSKGGFGSVPVAIAAWILQVPIILHESDITPGLANKFLSGFAAIIFVSFPKTEYFKPEKMFIMGNPIRRELLEGSKKEAEEAFDLKLEKPVLLITGGSQGSQRINDKILEILPRLLERFEIIHQVGIHNLEQVKAEARVVISKESEKEYHLFPFFKEEELRKAYHAADFIISRAGSGSIFEIAAVGKPSILIPIPESAQSHQVKNAYSYAEGGAALVLEEGNFTPRFFLEKLKYLFAHPDELRKMEKAARKFARPQAAENIAEYILSIIQSKSY